MYQKATGSPLEIQSPLKDRPPLWNFKKAQLIPPPRKIPLQNSPAPLNSGHISDLLLALNYC